MSVPRCPNDHRHRVPQVALRGEGLMDADTAKKVVRGYAALLLLVGFFFLLLGVVSGIVLVYDILTGNPSGDITGVGAWRHYDGGCGGRWCLGNPLNAPFLIGVLAAFALIPAGWSLWQLRGGRRFAVGLFILLALFLGTFAVFFSGVVQLWLIIAVLFCVSGAGILQYNGAVKSVITEAPASLTLRFGGKS